MPAALTTSSSSTPKKNLNSSMITYKKKVNKDYGKNERENENAEDLKSNSVSENVNSENKINDSLHKDVICEKLEHNIDSPCIVEIEEINSKNKFYNEVLPNL